MDETPLYFDHVTGKTMDVKSADSIEICHTGSDKTRYTLVVTITASGAMLPGYIIRRGLVKPPAIFKQNCPDNLLMHASASGKMDEVTMIDYIHRVIKPYLIKIEKSKCCLILDEARSHYTPEIKKYMLVN